MKNIYINFCDFYNKFNKQNNNFIKILRKHYRVEISDQPEFLFYSCFGNKFKNFDNCIKIFYTGENVRPDFNDCDYAIGFDYITFENRYFRQSRFVTHPAFNCSDEELLSRKFCNFIYSNSSVGEGAAIRQDFCKKLMQYKHIDCPGKVLNNMRDAIEPRNGNWIAGKLDFIKRYKFTIAFENSSSPGYVTEKLMHPLQVNSVPIYWGDPVVTREFNPGAFVNSHDFVDFDEVIEFVEYLDTHDDAYLNMLRQPPMQADYDPSEHDLEKFLRHIIEHGTPQAKDSRGIYAHPHEKNLQIALTSVTQKILQPIVSSCGLDANALLRDLPYRPKDDSLMQPVLDCVGKVSLSGLTGGDTTPPHHIPIALRDRYTMGGTVPVIDFYRDDRRHTPVHNTKEVYARTINAIQKGTFTYYGETLAYLQAAFEEFPLAGKTVLVCGLGGCNCDALSLEAGAERVIVVDYTPPRCDHPGVDVMTMAELKKSGLKADIALSISSFEHDGLGRYGDPLDPEGDFRAMEEATRHLKTDGLLFLAVPVGQDCLAWNAHRIYGPRRLPLLLRKWTFLKVFGLKPEDFTVNPLGRHIQPVIVLSNNPAAVHIPPSATPQQIREISELAAHGAFDRAYYMKSYPDVLAGGMDVVSHYVLCGAAEGKNPAPWFDTKSYCEKNRKIVGTGCNPFHHYLIAGQTDDWFKRLRRCFIQFLN